MISLFDVRCEQGQQTFASVRTCDHPRLACDTSRATEDKDDGVAVLYMVYTRDLWNTRAYKVV